MKAMEHEEITGMIIQAAYRVHNTLGAGFLEKVYHNALLINFGTSVTIKRKYRTYKKNREE